MSDGVVNIVGVGNALMGDDGVGVAALEALSRRALAERVRLHEAGLAVADVLGRLDPDEALIVLDAVRGGGPPGSLYRLEIDVSNADEPAAAARISLHELSVVPALQIEALSGRVFRDVTVFGVEPAEVAWGTELSDVVAQAVGRLVDAVLQMVGRPPAGQAGCPTTAGVVE